MSDSSACMVTPLIPSTYTQANHVSILHTSLFHLYLMLQSHQLHLGLVIQLVSSQVVTHDIHKSQ